MKLPGKEKKKEKEKKRKHTSKQTNETQTLRNKQMQLCFDCTSKITASSKLSNTNLNYMRTDPKIKMKHRYGSRKLMKRLTKILSKE